MNNLMVRLLFKQQKFITQTKGITTSNIIKTKITNQQDVTSNLSQSQKRLLERLKKKRVDEVFEDKQLRTTQNRIGILITVFVVTIYAYSMYAVKQETFLDDFDEPAMPNPPDVPTKKIK
jgi:hypothetical protein